MRQDRSGDRGWAERVRKAWRDCLEAERRADLVDDDANERRARDARNDLFRVLSGRRPIPESVREARRRFEEDTEDHDEAIRAGDPVAQERNQELMRQATDAECAAGIHRFCACRHRKQHDAPVPDEEDPVTGTWFDERRAQVWGVIQPDGSVVAKGFVGDETADEDKAAHPAGSLAYYSPEHGWTNAATGHPASRGPSDPPPREETDVRQDRFGALGPKRDQQSLANTYPATGYGERTMIYRLDGSTVEYVYTAGGWRMVPGTDTKAEAKAEVERDLAALAAEQKRSEPDVKVHHSAGCSLCGRTDEHAHTQADWRRHVDSAGEEAKRQREEEAQHRKSLADAERRARDIRDLDDSSDVPDPAQERDTPKTPPPTSPRPSAAPTTNGAAGGTGMSSPIEEAKAGVAGANEDANQGIAGLQQAEASLDAARSRLMQATAGSGQPEFETAIGLLSQALDQIKDATTAALGAVQESETGAAHL